MAQNQNYAWGDAPLVIEDEAPATPKVVEAPAKKKLPAPKTFTLVPKDLVSGQAPIVMPVVNTKTDPTEVLPHLDAFNEALLASVKRLLGPERAKNEQLLPTPIGLDDIMADIDLCHAMNFAITASAADFGIVEGGEKITMVRSLLDGVLRTEDGDFPEEPILVGASHTGFGLHSKRQYKMSGIEQWIWAGFVFMPDGKIRWPETVEEYRLWTYMMRKPQQFNFSGCLPHVRGEEAFARRAEVLARFQQMLASTRDAEALAVMPVHVVLAGTRWGTQFRGDSLRVSTSNTPLAVGDGQLLTYTGLAWQVLLNIHGQTLSGAVFVHEDGRFCCSTWCQREITKEHGTESYGGATMKHSLLSWALGPGASRQGSGQGPNHVGERNALRPLKLLPIQAEALVPEGDAKGIALARYIMEHPRSAVQLAGPTRIRPESRWPCIYLNVLDAAWTQYKIDPDKAIGHNPWMSFYMAVSLPVGFISITGEFRRGGFKVGEHDIYSLQFRSVAYQEWPKHATLHQAQIAKEPLWWYNLHLTDPAEQLELLTLMGMESAHPIAEKMADIIQKFLNA